MATSYTHECKPEWGCMTYNQTKDWCADRGGYMISYSDYQEQRDVSPACIKALDVCG